MKVTAKNPALSVNFLRGFVNAYRCVGWGRVSQKCVPDCPKTVVYPNNLVHLVIKELT